MNDLQLLNKIRELLEGAIAQGYGSEVGLQINKFSDELAGLSLTTTESRANGYEALDLFVTDFQPATVSQSESFLE